MHISIHEDKNALSLDLSLKSCRKKELSQKKSL